MAVRKKRTKLQVRSAASTPKGVVIDKALKRRWLDALSRYRNARATETTGWDDRYEALGEILDGDPPFYLAGGFKTARDFLRAEVPDQNERTIRTYIRVARYFDPEDEAKFGVTKLEGLLDYLEAAGGVPLVPAKVRPEKQKIPVERGKVVRRVLFDEVTKDELRVATRKAASGSGHASKPLPPLVKALRAVLSKAKLGGIGVRLRQKRLDLSGIAPDRLGKLGKALAGARLPALGES